MFGMVKPDHQVVAVHKVRGLERVEVAGGSGRLDRRAGRPPPPRVGPRAEAQKDDDPVGFQQGTAKNPSFVAPAKAGAQ